MIYERISLFIPKDLLGKFKKLLIYANVEIPEKKLVGFLILYGFLLSAGISINAYYFFNIHFVPVFIVVLLMFFVSIYLWLSSVAENRSRFVDNVLPDALELISSNMKSGITKEKALFLAAKPEFGPLSEALVQASKLVVAGVPLEQALFEMSRKLNSNLLRKTMDLVIQGISFGGELSDLLMELSRNIRSKKDLEDEIKATINVYVLLIFIVSAVAAPLLFGVSSFIVEIVVKQQEVLTLLPGTSATVFGAAMVSNAVDGQGITPMFIVIFSSILLFLNSVFGGWVIGIINTGKERGGFHLIPIIMVVAFILFFAVRIALISFFSSVFTFL